MVLRRVILLLVLACCPTGALAQVRVTMHDGRVSVSATEATPRQILTEWARVGQARVVNLDKLSGAPLTLELTDVPELKALDIILRATAGYVAAPRRQAVTRGAQFDRILIVGTTSVSSAGSPAAARRPPAAPAGPAALPPALFGGQEPVESVVEPVYVPEDRVIRAEINPAPPQGGAPARPSPQFSIFPQAPPSAPRPDPAPAPTRPAPSAPIGVAAPGMVVPAPPAPQNQDTPDDEP